MNVESRLLPSMALVIVIANILMIVAINTPLMVLVDTNFLGERSLARFDQSRSHLIG